MTKVLIVEDECILRQGIISLINWKQLNCEISGECPNGTEAAKFLDINEIDLVITDIKMPGMNGLELAKHISDTHPQTGIIVLSAYSDFEYAQQAISLGIFNYVLKSNFIKDLPNAVKSWIDKKKSQENSLVGPNFTAKTDIQMKPIIIKSILDGSLQEEEILSWFACCHIHLKNYFIIFSEIDDTEQKNFTKKTEKLSHSVHNFFDLAFKDYNHLCVPLNDNLLFVLVNFDSPNEMANLRSIVVVCNEILSTVKNYMTFSLNMGVSSQHTQPLKMKEAGEEAKYTLNHIFQNSGIVLYQDIMKQKYNGSLPNLQKCADIILNDISSHNQQQLTKHLQEIFNDYKSCNNDLENLKIEILLLSSICFRRMTDKNIYIACNDNLQQKTSSRIIQCQTPNTLHKITECAFQDIIKMDLSTPTHYNHLVIQVNNFIKENYNLPIKLDDMAQLFHVNSSYLSRLYKKETGDSIVTALNKYRIQKAKELLKNNDYLVFEVGCLVGIKDSAYFTNVFTKYAGTSPQNYKSANEERY